MSEQNSNAQMISGAIVLVFISVMLFKSCVKSEPNPVKTAKAEVVAPPSDNELISVLKDSNQFKQHKKAFMEAAKDLIVEGRCTAADFKEMGGWVSSTTYKNSPVFFTYCGGMKLQNKIYVDASNGRIFTEGL